MHNVKAEKLTEETCPGFRQNPFSKYSYEPAHLPSGSAPVFHGCMN
jgi:hypothetical protein